MSTKFTAIFSEPITAGSHCNTITKMRRIEQIDGETVAGMLEREGIYDCVEFLFLGHPPMGGEQAAESEATNADSRLARFETWLEMNEKTAPLSAVSVDPLVRRELVHQWLSKPEDFLAEIEKTGGWPEGYTHVSFFHDGPSGDRYCKFTTYPLRTRWWTTVATSDDYYYWKLSDTKKAEIMKQARQQVIKQLR